MCMQTIITACFNTVGCSMRALSRALRMSMDVLMKHYSML